MTIFEERERGEEARFRHDQELYFKVRNRRNKLLGLKIAQDYLGLGGDAALAYAKDVVMADFDRPGDDDVLAKIRTDLAKVDRSMSDDDLAALLRSLEASAKAAVMAE